MEDDLKKKGGSQQPLVDFYAILNLKRRKLRGYLEGGFTQQSLFHIYLAKAGNNGFGTVVCLCILYFIFYLATS